MASEGGERKPECLLFDLDGTLYLDSDGYVGHCRARAGEYLAKKLGMTKEEAEEKRKLALKTSNQTVKGLRALGYEIDDVEFVTYMRDGVEKFLKPNEKLSEFLSSLPAKKYIFTNTREVEAEKALKCLGIREHFLQVYGVRSFSQTFATCCCFSLKANDFLFFFPFLLLMAMLVPAG